MKPMLEVCLVALTLANVGTPSLGAQTLAAASRDSLLAEARAGAAQTMQKGVSVELPVTSNAKPVPKADNEDALIVSVTYDGKVYLGVTPVSIDELGEKVKQALSNRAEKTLYIKGDARTPYGSVVKVLDSVRTAGVEGLTLLTAQHDTGQPGTLVPPKGLEMPVVSPRPADPNSSGAEGR